MIPLAPRSLLYGGGDPFYMASLLYNSDPDPFYVANLPYNKDPDHFYIDDLFYMTPVLTLLYK